MPSSDVERRPSAQKNMRGKRGESAQRSRGIRPARLANEQALRKSWRARKENFYIADYKAFLSLWAEENVANP